MTHYRVYRLNPAGKIESAEWLEADDEGQAVELARQLRQPGTRAIEVWCGAKRVAVIECSAAGGDPSGRPQ